jgi:hypothetical protein
VRSIVVGEAETRNLRALERDAHQGMNTEAQQIYDLQAIQAVE